MKTKSQELAPLTVSAEEIAEVNRKHERVCDGASMKEAIVSHVNEVREIGLVLAGMAQRVKHGQFEKLFASQDKTNPGVRFAFTAKTARLYIRLANRLPNPVAELPDAVASVKDFMRWTGALASTRGPGNARPENPFAALMHGVQEITRTFRKWKDGSPIDEWPEHKRQQAMDQLKPVVDFYNELSALEVGV